MIRAVGLAILLFAMGSVWIGTTLYYLKEFIVQKEPWAAVMFGVQTTLTIAIVMVIHG